MAEFRGSQCDECGKVVEKEVVTKKTVRYVGPDLNGEYKLDLCPECAGDERDKIPEEVELKPLQKRQKKSEPAE